MVNFGKKLMADQVEEWKGYDFSLNDLSLSLFRAKVLYFHICLLGYINPPY